LTLWSGETSCFCAHTGTSCQCFEKVHVASASTKAIRIRIRQANCRAA
jgi:hypothetical protein